MCVGDDGLVVGRVANVIAQWVTHQLTHPLQPGKCRFLSATGTIVTVRSLPILGGGRRHVAVDVVVTDWHDALPQGAR
jgi:hypothetical protein